MATAKVVSPQCAVLQEKKVEQQNKSQETSEVMVEQPKQVEAPKVLTETEQGDVAAAENGLETQEKQEQKEITLINETAKEEGKDDDCGDQDVDEAKAALEVLELEKKDCAVHNEKKSCKVAPEPEESVAQPDEGETAKAKDAEEGMEDATEKQGDDQVAEAAPASGTEEPSVTVAAQEGVAA